MSHGSLIHQELFERLGRIGIAARQAVESALSGQHRSARRGLSVEFAGHRPYQSGDDLRHLDWSVLARSDRYDIRVFEEETRLRATLVLDASGSMAFASRDPSKWEVARQLTAALAFLMVRQDDAVGLAIVDTAVRTHVAAASTPAHLARLLTTLELAKPGGDTALGPVLESLALQLHRRGLVVVVTDGFDDPARLATALRLLRHRRQEVRIFLIQDAAECTLPVTGMIHFNSLEGEPSITVDADRVRPHYREAFRLHQRQLAEHCYELGIPLEIIPTEADLAWSLGRALNTSRSSQRSSPHRGQNSSFGPR